MKREITCIVCPAGCRITIDGEIHGYSCERGLEYAQNEMTAPTRSVSSTVILCKSPHHSRLPVKTDRPIAKALARDAVRILNSISIDAPVKRGDIVLANVLGSGVNFVAARSIE